MCFGNTSVFRSGSSVDHAHSFILYSNPNHCVHADLSRREKIIASNIKGECQTGKKKYEERGSMRYHGCEVR